MKKIIKNNLLVLISFMLLFLFTIKLNLDYRKYENSNLESLKEIYTENCKNNIKVEYIEQCDKIELELKSGKDYFTMFSNAFAFSIPMFHIRLLLPIFVIIPSLFYACRSFKNKQIYNHYPRSGYGNYLKKVFKEVYKAIWILPLIVSIELIVCIICTGGIGNEYSILFETTTWNSFTLNHPVLFIILYVLNFLIHSILYVNIGLCVARKHHNYFIAIALTLLSIIGIELFLEVGVSVLIFNIILNNHTNVGILFNIINMVAFNDQYGFGTCMIVPSVLMIISSIVVFKFYKNKEDLIIDCEKNEVKE